VFPIIVFVGDFFHYVGSGSRDLGKMNIIEIMLVTRSERNGSWRARHGPTLHGEARKKVIRHMVERDLNI
jgi:hypothetical protein